MNVLIMAGGNGTRLWPLSRKNNPKQLLKLVGNQTLLENTFERLNKKFSKKQIFIATTSLHKNLVAKQLPQIPKSQYSIEPVLKDRGPAIALAVLIMNHHDPSSCFVTAWSDHYIKNEVSYFEALDAAKKFLEKHPKYFLTIGVLPSYPHTGFGYINQGKPLANNVYSVDKFTEKPDLKTAQKLLKNKKSLWNTGYFIAKTNTLLNLYQKHQPKIYEILEKIKPFVGTKKQQSAINKYYPSMPHIDIEKGLIEKLKKIAVIPAQFDWADIGSWKTIKDVLSVEENNLTHGKVTTHNTKKSLIYNYENKLVAVVGAEDMVVVNTKNALLIAPKNKSEEVKALVKKIELDKNLRKHL